MRAIEVTVHISGEHEVFITASDDALTVIEQALKEGEIDCHRDSCVMELKGIGEVKVEGITATAYWKDVGKVVSTLIEDEKI